MALAAGVAWHVASAADIVPHRAVYDMRLGVARHNSGIVDVRGSMLIETAESCEGWETTQRIKLTFSSTDTGESDSESIFASYESKDGLTYRFSVRNLEDGDLDEEYRGYANIDKPGGAGKAVFTLPERQEFPLPAGTLFPTGHMNRLIDKAEAGETFLPFKVFDGTKLEGASDVSTLVTGTQPKAVLKLDSPLLQGKVWIFRLAYFSADKNESQPDYEVSAEVLANGVSRAMTLDYGDFTVVGILRSIEPLPRGKCD